MKIGIIRCDSYSEKCAGYRCFPAMQERTGSFDEYDVVELVGFDTCGGCGGGKADRIVERATRLKNMGAEAIHIGNCMADLCPFKNLYKESLEKEIAIPVKIGTHPMHKSE